MKDLVLKHALINAVEHDGKGDIQAIVKKVLSEKPELKSKIKMLLAEIKKTTKEVNSWKIEKQNKKMEELGIEIEVKKKEEKLELPELPNAEMGKVVLRLAPFPDAPMHIGQARMIILNYYYAKKYKGKLFLVIDDTIGSGEKIIEPKAYDWIIEDLKWLGIDYDKIFYKSDRIELHYEVAESLIKKDAAYVCFCDVETLRKNREKGIKCSHRNHSIDENLRLWKEMLDEKYPEGKATLRLKTSMSNPNPAFRDRVLCRIVKREHPRVGKKYSVWPMLEFSWAVDDYYLGITHVIRGKDLVMEDLMEDFIWNVLGWKKSIFIHYGLFTIEEIGKISKTRIRKSIVSGEYSGWDDSRTWTLMSLKKRGIQPEAIKNFILRLGLSEADITVPVKILYSENRKLIDPIANRYFAIIDPVEIKIKDPQKVKEVRISLHPDFSEKGDRKITVNTEKIYVSSEDYKKFSGEEIGLAYLFVVKLDKTSRFISEKIPMNIQKIQWVSEPNVKIKILMPDGKIINVLAEPEIKKTKEDQIIQLVRIGFCKVNKVGKETILYFIHK